MAYWIIFAAIGSAALALTVRAAVRRPGDRYLCDTCRFNHDEGCHKPERPRAVRCLAYKQDGSAARASAG